MLKAIFTLMHVVNKNECVNNDVNMYLTIKIHVFVKRNKTHIMEKRSKLFYSKGK